VVWVVREGDAKIRVLPDVAVVVPSTGDRLTVCENKRLTADAGIPDIIGGDRTIERIEWEGDVLRNSV